MENGSASHEKAGLFARAWWWMKALPEKCQTKIVESAQKIKKIGKDDPRRVIHSLKVGLALALVSIVYYFRPLYDGFGVSAMWAVLTVVVVFEFTVGATLCKGINRAIATLVAGALGVGAHHLASLAEEKGEPILLGLFVFIIAGAATFSRFIPSIKARYDYGVVIFILTFSLVSVSGYRVDKILELAHQRLSTIIIGSVICVIISIFICPVWAGEDLHKMVALNMEKLAIFLEGFGGMHLNGEIAGVNKDEKSFLEEYKSVLNSKASEESLANFARWEPGHGRFRFGHPWDQYLKIGTVTRECAYRVEALTGFINSETQVPPEFQRKIQEACTKMSTECGKALTELASAIRKTIHPSAADLHVMNSKSAVEELKTALKTALAENTDLLEVIPATTVAFLLVEIVTYTEKLAESVHELASQAKFKCVKQTVNLEKPQLLHRGTVKPLSVDDGPHILITVSGLSENVNPQAAITSR